MYLTIGAAPNSTRTPASPQVASCTNDGANRRTEEFSQLISPSSPEAAVAEAHCRRTLGE